MESDPRRTLLSQEQVNCLIDLCQMGEEIERLELRRRLKAELRRKHFEGRWFKPFDLWTIGAQILGASLLVCLILIVTVLLT